MAEPKTAPFSLLPAGAAAPSEPWARMALSGVPRFDAKSVLAQWSRLQAGQGDFAPPTGELLEGWAHYHGGDFERAATVGLQCGGSGGLALANRATAIYATYVEPREAVRLALFRHVAERAGEQAHESPGDCQAHYSHAYAL